MTPRSHTEIIALWPNCAEFARAIGVTPANGRRMRERGAIPAAHYQAVVDAIIRAGFPFLTYADVAATAPRKDGPSGQSEENGRS